MFRNARRLRAIEVAIAVVCIAVFLVGSRSASADSPEVVNVAPQAAVTASSQNVSTGQLAVKAVDGYTDGCCNGDVTHEWATVGGMAGSWLNLTWSSAQTVDHVVLYDRPNTNDQITGGALTFSDGSTVPVPTLANNGSPVTVTFSTRETTSLRLTVTSVGAYTHNVGLAEIQVWGLAAPKPPSSYTVPPGITVTPADDLQSVLDQDVREHPETQNIILADGVYQHDDRFVNRYGHHIYSQHLGGAVLEAGIEMGGNWGNPGSLIQGVVFDVSDASKTLNSGIVHIWGDPGADSTVLDCVFHGHNAIEVGLLARNPDGLVAQRLQFYDFKGVALRASDDTEVPYGEATPIIDNISDIYVDGVTSQGTSEGTGEAGLWIGHPVENGVQRIEVRNVSWSGIETVNDSWNTTFNDLDIDMSGPNECPAAGVGIYLEHFNYHNTFQRFAIRGANTGINAEWDDGIEGNAASHFTTIEDGLIDAVGAYQPATIGVWLDAGTESTTIARVTFRNQSFAAIDIDAGIDELQYSLIDNDYSGIEPTAVPISDERPPDSIPCT